MSGSPKLRRVPGQAGVASVRPAPALAAALALALLAGAPGGAASAERGKVSGAVAHAAPDWFKQSFLEIRDDVEEAAEADKHVMLFFDLNDCPYCARMLEESFASEPYKSYVQTHFDVISINVQGDREVAFNDEITMSEKDLADLLQIRATPAILFLDAGNKPVARVNGYRSPKRFQSVLEYVSSKSYSGMSLADYLEKHRAADAWTLQPHPLFREVEDLSSVVGPLALVFEDSGCFDCAEFHRRLLGNPNIAEALQAFTVVRLDTGSVATIVDPTGKRTTALALAREHDMTYRPGVMLFDGGQLIRRHDSLLNTFHFTESLRYVGSGAHKTLAYGEFRDRHREALLSKGIDIDLAK